MTPSFVQVPPLGYAVGHRARGAPPRTSMIRNWPSAKKPSDRPSGDQNGQLAPSVRSTRKACALFNARSQIAARPWGSDATKAIVPPSGEKAE